MSDGFRARRGISQVHQNNFDASLLQPLHPAAQRDCSAARTGVPDIVGAELPHDQIGPVAQDVLFKAREIATHRLERASAVDQGDVLGRVSA